MSCDDETVIDCNPENEIVISTPEEVALIVGDVINELVEPGCEIVEIVTGCEVGPPGPQGPAGVLPNFNPFRFVTTDDEGNLSDVPWQWSEEEIIIQVGPNPEDVISLNIQGLSSILQTLSELGVLKLPTLLGNSEFFGVIARPDGVTPISLAFIDTRGPYTPFQAGLLDGDNFAMLAVRPDQTTIFLASAAGFQLGNGATVNRIDTFLSPDDTKLPTSAAVLSAIQNISASVDADSFVNTPYTSWADIADIGTDIFLGSIGNDSNEAVSGSTRHRVSLGSAPENMYDVDELHIRMWVDSSSLDVYGVVYEDNGGLPGNLLYTSDLVNISNTIEQEVIFPFSVPFDIASGTPLWIGFRNITSGTTLRVSVKNTGFNYTYSSPGAGPDDPFNIGAASNNSGTLNAYLVGHPQKVELTISGFVDKTGDSMSGPLNMGAPININNADLNVAGGNLNLDGDIQLPRATDSISRRLINYYNIADGLGWRTGLYDVGAGANDWHLRIIAGYSALRARFSDGLIELVQGGVLPAETASRALILDANNKITSSGVTDVELGYLSGVTSSVQTQLNAKEDVANKSTNTSLGVSNTLYPTQGAVKAYVDAILAAQDALVFKGFIDCSTNPNYPAADCGHTYKVSVAGKIGGASGPNVEVGDLLTCLVDGTASGNHATVGANWNITQVNIDGAVTGPASSILDNFATFNGTSGKVIKDSGLALSIDGTLAANSDANIPSQKAVKTYADTKEPAISAGSINQYWRGDKSWQTLDKNAVNLGNVDNTSDATKNGAAVTLSNKRITPRVYTNTNVTTLTPEKDTYDCFALTAQTSNLTIANHSTTTPANFEKIEIRIIPAATGTISFGSNYVARGGIALPTGFTNAKMLTLGFEWVSAINAYNLIALALET